MSFLFLYKEQGRIIAPIRHVCSSTKRPDETIFIRHLLIRVGAYAMHTFVQYLRKVCRSECQRANITGDVFATPSLPQPLHGTVVIFNSLFRSLYWRLFDWLQTRAPLSGEGGEGGDGDDAVLLRILFRFSRFLDISAHWRSVWLKKKPCFSFSWSYLCWNDAPSFWKFRSLDLIFRFVCFIWIFKSVYFFFLLSWILTILSNVDISRIEQKEIFLIFLIEIKYV